jgi:hypothetical protein
MLDPCNSWNIITALATVATAVAATAAVLVAIYQTRANLRVQREQLGIQSLQQLLAEWQSPQMIKTRARADVILLNRSTLRDDNTPTQDLDNVLDFFETVAVFHRRGILDAELTWHTFYWYMVNYWHPSEPYIRAVQLSEGPETWKDLSDLMPELIRREGGALLTEAATFHFLRDEAFAGGEEISNAFIGAINNPQNHWRR